MFYPPNVFEKKKELKKKGHYEYIMKTLGLKNLIQEDNQIHKNRQLQYLMKDETVFFTHPLQ